MNIKLPPMPSNWRRSRWLFAAAPGAQPITGAVGKLMVFGKAAEIDALWLTISLAVEAGELSPYAKVSTARGTAPGLDHVICVYVADATDTPGIDLLRIRLFDLGISKRPRFKAGAP